MKYLKYGAFVIIMVGLLIWGGYGLYKKQKTIEYEIFNLEYQLMGARDHLKEKNEVIRLAVSYENTQLPLSEDDLKMMKTGLVIRLHNNICMSCYFGSTKYLFNKLEKAGIPYTVLGSYPNSSKFRKQLKDLEAETTSILNLPSFAGVYNLKRGSADGRLFLWKIATQAIAKEPVFGVGLGNFAGAYGQAQYNYFSKGIDEKEAMTADCPAYAFNEFLQIGVEQGIIGLLLFLGVVILAIRGCLRDKKKAGILGAIVAVLVFAFTSYPFSVLPICIAFVVVVALANAGMERIKINKFILAALFFAICIYNFSFLHNATALTNAYASWSRLSLISISKDMDDNISEDYSKIENWLVCYPGYLYSFGNVLAREG